MWGRCWQDGREGLKLMGRISTRVIVVAVTKGLGRIVCWYVGEMRSFSCWKVCCIGRVHVTYLSGYI